MKDLPFQLPVRQLEAIIRITESLASCVFHLLLLRNTSRKQSDYSLPTMDAVDQGLGSSNDVTLNAEIKKVEQELRRRLPIGWSTAYIRQVKSLLIQVRLVLL